MKPNYLIIGAMKCGTSTLCAYLEDHPGVFMVKGGEPNYFSHDENFAKGPDWYEAHFAGARPDQPVGEGSNDYVNGARFPDTAARMAAYNPDLKLIYITRNPISRITSAWVQNRIDLGDLVPASLDAAVRDQPERFIDQSLYWKNLEHYRAHFPDAQIHIAFMEDLKTDPQAVFAGICGFLGVAPTAEIARPHMNKGEGKRIPSASWGRIKALPGVQLLRDLVPRETRMAIRQKFFSQDAKTADFSPQTRAWLIDQLREDAAQFLAHAGKPADFWRLA